MTSRNRLLKCLLLALVGASLAAIVRAQEKRSTIKGYVLDSSCAFTKNLKKPVSPECAVACAKGGSPLVILTDDGTVYWPISESVPATGQNQRLMKFAGQMVTATGKVYERGGSRALVIEQIEVLRAEQ